MPRAPLLAVESPPGLERGGEGAVIILFVAIGVGVVLLGALLLWVTVIGKL